MLHKHLLFLESALCNQEVFDGGSYVQFHNIYNHSEVNYQDRNSKKKLISIGNYARLILIRLAVDGHITLDPDFKPTINAQGSFDTVKIYKEVYPKSVVELLTMSTEIRAQDNPDLINKKLYDSWSQLGVRYKSASASCLTLARVCLTQGISDLCDFEIKHWAEFKSDYDKSNSVAITITSLVKALTIAYNKPKIESDYNKYESSRRTAPSLAGATAKHKDSNIEVISGSSSRAIRLTGEWCFLDKNNTKINIYPISVEIYRSYNNNVVSYDYWDSHNKNLTDFLPENIEDSIWRTSQQDYIDKKVELNTKKVSSSRLRYLNLYLFSYLPSYYNTLSSTPFYFPNTPKKFISTVFVERSAIFEAELDNLPSDFSFPVPLKSFIEDMTSINSKISTYGNNAARDVIREIDSFFDHLVTRSSDESSDYYLSSNPIKGTTNKPLGIKYIKSNKSVLPVDYWAGFRVFLRKVTNVITNDNLTNLKSRTPHSRSLALMSKYAINESFEHFGNEISITSIDISKLARLQLLTSSDNAIYIPDHTYWAKILFIAYSGNRSTNTHWIDANNFDFIYHSRGYDTSSQFVPIVINTDKSKDKMFESYVPHFVFDELVKTKEILNLNNYKWALEPINYQNNESSKWGKITPLFRRAESHYNKAENNLSPLLEVFEKCLSENNIDFESQLFFAPALHLTKKDFSYLKKRGKALPHYTEAKVKYVPDVKVSFTPIESTTLQTPHSLRVMVSSVFSPLIGDDLISKFMTGQTESTVGYYTLEFTDESSQNLIAHLHHLLKLGNRDIATPKSSRINENDFKKRVEDGTAMTYYQCQSINMAPTDTDDDEENSQPDGGLSVMTLANVSSLAFNRTHICPFNNECPRGIIKSIGEKNCSECLYAITTTNHLPSIAAKIRKLSEDIVDVRERLIQEGLFDDEIYELENKKKAYVREASNWYVRLTIANQNKEQFIVSEEGRKRLIYDNVNLKSEFSKESQLIKRLHETVGSEMLQSDSLKRRALRLSRRIESLAISNDWQGHSDISEVSEAYNNFLNICSIFKLNEQQQISLLSDENIERKNITSKALEVLQ